MSLTVKPNGDIVVVSDATYDEKLRARRLILDLAQTEPYQITFELEKQLIVGGIVADTDHAGMLTKVFATVAPEMQTFTDPTTGLSHTISVAGIAAGIQAAFTRWLVAGSR